MNDDQVANGRRRTVANRLEPEPTFFQPGWLLLKDHPRPFSASEAGLTVSWYEFDWQNSAILGAVLGSTVYSQEEWNRLTESVSGNPMRRILTELNFTKTVFPASNSIGTLEVPYVLTPSTAETTASTAQSPSSFAPTASATQPQMSVEPAASPTEQPSFAESTVNPTQPPSPSRVSQATTINGGPTASASIVTSGVESPEAQYHTIQVKATTGALMIFGGLALCLSGFCYWLGYRNASTSPRGYEAIPSVERNDARGKELTEMCEIQVSDFDAKGEPN